MTPQTLTSISEARLEQSTSLLSADVSARSADDSFDTPRSDVTEATDSGPSSGSPEDGEEPSAHMTDSSVGSVADDTATTIYGQLAHSPAAHGLVEQSHDDMAFLGIPPPPLPRTGCSVALCSAGADQGPDRPCRAGPRGRPCRAGH